MYKPPLMIAKCLCRRAAPEGGPYIRATEGDCYTTLHEGKRGRKTARCPDYGAPKSERPVGVPAALAWGMEGLHSEDQSFSGVVGRSAALASSRTTHRSKIAMIIHSTTPEAEPNSRLHC
jgi:hypothetical protein